VKVAGEKPTAETHRMKHKKKLDKQKKMIKQPIHLQFRRISR